MVHVVSLLLLPSSIFAITILSFSFFCQKWLERNVFCYCLSLALMPSQASTANSMSGDADVNLEIKIL